VLALLFDGDVGSTRGASDESADFWESFGFEKYGGGRDGKEAAFKAAEAKLSELDEKRANNQRLDKPPAQVTFREAAEAWFTHGRNKRGRPWRASTRRDYRSALDRWLLPRLGDLQLAEVNDAHIEEFLAAAEAAGLADGTRQKLLTILHIIFVRARKRREWGLSANPVNAVDSIAGAERAEFEIYSPDEVAALLRAAASPADAALFLTAVGAGLRRGELIALGVGDVAFGERKIRIEHSYAVGVETKPKSGKTRTVPLREDVSRALASLLNERGNPPDEALVFPDADGEHQSCPAVSARYVEARDRAGLRSLSFHALRHTWATQLAKKGFPHRRFRSGRATAASSRRSVTSSIPPLTMRVPTCSIGRSGSRATRHGSQDGLRVRRRLSSFEPRATTTLQAFSTCSPHRRRDGLGRRHRLPADCLRIGR
jgi:integrase